MTDLPPDITALPAPPFAASPVDPAGPVRQEGPSVDPERLWQARPELHAVYLAAWRHLTSPFAVLAGVLVRSLSVIPYRVRYRSAWRAQGSPLNLMVALAGNSGAGKSLLDEIAAGVVEFLGADISPQETPRSGEGIPASIGTTRTEATEDGGSRTVVEYRRADRAHRFYWDEIGKLSAQSRRTGATMIEYLKELVSGSTLGGQNAAGDGLVIPGRTYRATVTLAVQPRRAGALLGSAETEGGLQGRIVWFSLHYPKWATEPLAPPARDDAPIRVETAQWDGHDGFIDALPEMNAEHEYDRRAGHAGARDDSESHLTLARAVIAIALMNLAGRTVLNVEDWELAGLVTQHSHDTLTDVRAQLAADDSNAAEEQLQREHAVIATLHERRDKGMSWRDAYGRLSPRGRETARTLEVDGRLERW